SRAAFRPGNGQASLGANLGTGGGIMRHGQPSLAVSGMRYLFFKTLPQYSVTWNAVRAGQ
ncbi:hypothetical protein, partial [Bradyrhizobium sp.]|uniref:hypothetical protein n=1 Tax=Bradyrhizobium sp. TaxID=376 RepID=UPI003C68BB5E